MWQQIMRFENVNQAIEKTFQKILEVSYGHNKVLV